VSESLRSTGRRSSTRRRWITTDRTVISLDTMAAIDLDPEDARGRLAAISRERFADRNQKLRDELSFGGGLEDRMAQTLL
jgi:hypothetical protein